MTGYFPQLRFFHAVTLVCFVLLTFLACSNDLQAEAKKELFHNEDSTNFFYFQEIPDGKTAIGELIDHYIDVMADAGVTTFLCNTNARRTNYHSDVWDTYWGSYDPDGPDDQPFLKPMGPGGDKEYRKLIGNMLKVHQQGIDYPARIAERCRHRGISPWITLRMNDCHFNHNPAHPFHGTFWKKNPQFARKNCTGYFATCLDYAHPEVRDYYMALIDETLRRYDIDGLELDFMREPYLFSAGKEAEGAVILTDWIRQVRKTIDAAAARRRHPINLGVRVPSCPKTASKMGLKAVDWAKQGLIDVLVAAPRWDTLEFDMPIEEWKRLLAGTKTKLLGGLEVNYRPCSGGTASYVTPEIATGAAVCVLSRGADAVYLFNYFQNGHPKWAPDVYRKTLSDMTSLDSLLKKPRRVGVTHRDIVAPGEKYRPPLPANGKEIVFPFRLGPVIAKSVPCELLIGLASSKESTTPAPSVSVNGKACKVISDTASKTAERQIVFSVPQEALKASGAQEVKISAANGEPLTLERLEMSLGP
ncbi:MAG: family 10 glycosylhydrolase [Pirellulales bacterium]|nr:family 10 glycosylhydrolase [Pirellulales bacterium]